MRAASALNEAIRTCGFDRNRSSSNMLHQSTTRSLFPCFSQSIHSSQNALHCTIESFFCSFFLVHHSLRVISLATGDLRLNRVLIKHSPGACLLPFVDVAVLSCAKIIDDPKLKLIHYLGLGCVTSVSSAAFTLQVMDHRLLCSCDVWIDGVAVVAGGLSWGRCP